MGLSQKAGLTPEPAERLQYHVHAHLDVFVNGTRVPVPAGIGIDTDQPVRGESSISTAARSAGV